MGVRHTLFPYAFRVYGDWSSARMKRKFGLLAPYAEEQNIKVAIMVAKTPHGHVMRHDKLRVALLCRRWMDASLAMIPSLVFGSKNSLKLLMPLCLILILRVLALGALDVRNQEFRNESAGNATVTFVTDAGQISSIHRN